MDDKLQSSDDRKPVIFCGKCDEDDLANDGASNAECTEGANTQKKNLAVKYLLCVHRLNRRSQS